MSSKAVFDELVLTCVTELFQTHGVVLRATSRTEDAMEYASTIGFSSDKLRGMLGLGMNPATLEGVMVKNGMPISSFNAEDWLAEAVNQLLGRLKNKLMGYGLVISLALPTVLRGVCLKFLAVRPTSLWTYTFESDLGLVSVWLDVRYEADLVLTRTDDPEMQGTPEGELVLF